MGTKHGASRRSAKEVDIRSAVEGGHGSTDGRSDRRTEYEGCPWLIWDLSENPTSSSVYKQPQRQPLIVNTGLARNQQRLH